MSSLFLFDFDDTLAMTEAHMAGPFYPRMQEMLAARNIHMSLEDLVVKNTELYREYGSSMHGWMHELNKDMAFTLQLFEEMAPTIREAVRPFMQPDPVLIERLQRLKAQGHTLAILTLGHREYCLPLIKLLGLDVIFPEDMVFDISVMKGLLKRHDETYEVLLSKYLTGDYKHKFMFEDSIANLLAAKRMDFHTFLIKDKELPEEVASSVDHHTATLLEALDALEANYIA